VDKRKPNFAAGADSACWLKMSISKLYSIVWSLNIFGQMGPKWDQEEKDHSKLRQFLEKEDEA